MHVQGFRGVLRCHALTSHIMQCFEEVLFAQQTWKLLRDFLPRS